MKEVSGLRLSIRQTLGQAQPTRTSRVPVSLERSLEAQGILNAAARRPMRTPSSTE